MEASKKRQTEQGQGVSLNYQDDDYTYRPAQQQQLAPIRTDQIEKEELIEEYKALIQYKNNQNKLDVLIQLEKDREQLEELNQMAKELQEAVIQQEEKIKAVQNNETFQYNTEILQEQDLGRLCKAYYESDNKFYHAQILSINTEDQEADIQFIGYDDILKMHVVFIKLMPKPDADLFHPGTECQAIFSEDGQYHPCVIDKIEEEKYHITYTKQKNKDTVTIFHLREAKKNNFQPGQKKKQFDDLSQFVLPDNLKVLPTDTPKQREQKKKKTKALKQQFKMAVIEKESQDKQSKWQQFKQNKSKFGGNTSVGSNKKSIFQTSDRVGSKVGVMNSGKGMSNFGIKERLQLEDNSHLSRQF